MTKCCAQFVIDINLPKCYSYDNKFFGQIGRPRCSRISSAFTLVSTIFPSIATITVFQVTEDDWLVIKVLITVKPLLSRQNGTQGYP